LVWSQSRAPLISSGSCPPEADQIPQKQPTVTERLYRPIFMGAANITTLTQSNFTTEVIQSAQPVLVDFWAEWCGPCKMLAPILDELATEYNGKVRIGKVNIDEYQELAAQYGIRSIPTLLLFKQGQVAEQLVGLRSKRDLKASFDKLTT
jgi:thioredoxin 1